MRTRNPETVWRVFRKDLRSVGCTLPRAVVKGEGEGAVGVGRLTGGSENIFCRETVPSLVEGRLISEGPILEKVGPTSSQPDAKAHGL